MLNSSTCLYHWLNYNLIVSVKAQNQVESNFRISLRLDLNSWRRVLDSSQNSFIVNDCQIKVLFLSKKFLKTIDPVRELAPGKYEAYVRAQIWQFTPREIRVPAGEFTAVGVQHQAEGSSRVTTLWCVEELDFLPVLPRQHDGWDSRST